MSVVSVFKKERTKMKLTNDEWGVLRQALYRQVSESYLDNATDKMKKMGTIAENLIVALSR